MLMLSVYTFVFSQIFKSNWKGMQIDSNNPIEFASLLFVGIFVFNFFAECLSRAPNLVIEKSNYVKKLIFPIEVVSPICVGAALVNMVISLILLLTIRLSLGNHTPISIIILPVIWLPFVLLSMAIVWLISAISVFVKDTSQFTAVITTIMMFLSPVFFPMSTVPQKWQGLLRLNPLAIVIETTRKVVLYGEWPDISTWLIYLFLTFIFCTFSLSIFVRLKPAFADVL